MKNVIPLDLAQLIRDGDMQGIYALVLSKFPLIISSLLIVLVGFVISNFLGKLLVKALVLKNVDPSVHPFIRTIVVFMLKLVFILTALSTLGVNVNSFVAALAAGGVTAGLGLQKSVNQFASGLEILINHPFKSGDYITVGDVSGVVKEIRLMHTELLTRGNVKVIMPNSHITENSIYNYHAEDHCRVELIFSVSYEADIEQARNAVLRVAGENEMILTDPAVTVNVKEHAASSINLVSYLWCDSKDYWPVYYYMQEAVKLEFDRCGISIPYNQLDIHIEKEEVK